MKTQITLEMNRKHNRIALAYFAIMIIIMSLLGIGCTSEMTKNQKSDNTSILICFVFFIGMIVGIIVKVLQDKGYIWKGKL